MTTWTPPSKDNYDYQTCKGCNIYQSPHNFGFKRFRGYELREYCNRCYDKYRRDKRKANKETSNRIKRRSIAAYNKWREAFDAKARG